MKTFASTAVLITAIVSARKMPDVSPEPTDFTDETIEQFSDEDQQYFEEIK